MESVQLQNLPNRKKIPWFKFMKGPNTLHTKRNFSFPKSSIFLRSRYPTGFTTEGRKWKKLLNIDVWYFLQELLLNNFGKPKFSEQQQAVLDMYFSVTKYPTAEQKQRILMETGLSMLQVNKWFDNKRNRDKHSAKNAKKSGPRIIIEQRKPAFESVPKFMITDKDFVWFFFLTPISVVAWIVWHKVISKIFSRADAIFRRNVLGLSVSV